MSGPPRSVKTRSLFLFILLLHFSCAEQGEGSKLVPRDRQVTPSSYFDPYFTETSDTVSAKGPKCITRNLVFDTEGTLWLSSWSGIISYDGKQFTNHTLKDSLKHFHTFSAFRDSRGDLWFGTIGAGAYRYDGNRFTLLSTRNGLGNDMVTAITEDKAGNIWFGTNRGASKYDGKTLTAYTAEEGLCDNEVQALAADRSGLVWLGGASGLFSYDGRYFKEVKTPSGTSFNNVRSIICDHNGDVWIGCGNGLFRFHETETKAINEIFTGYLYEDSRNVIWLSRADTVSANAFMSDPGGMALCRMDGTTITRIASEPQVFGILEGRDGSVYFGTVHGICRYKGTKIEQL